MKLKDGGRVIELRIFEANLPDVYLRNGAKPGRFPELIRVKQEQADGSEKVVEYVRKGEQQ